MSYTTEQIEAMAACLREINPGANAVALARTMRRHGIWNEYDEPAPWLQPPDDSVALDHPNAVDSSELELRRSRVSGKLRYVQWLTGGGAAMTDWHDSEEAARKEWNAICRRAK